MCGVRPLPPVEQRPSAKPRPYAVGDPEGARRGCERLRTRAEGGRGGRFRFERRGRRIRHRGGSGRRHASERAAVGTAGRDRRRNADRRGGRIPIRPPRDDAGGPPHLPVLVLLELFLQPEPVVDQRHELHCHQFHGEHLHLSDRSPIRRRGFQLGRLGRRRTGRVRQRHDGSGRCPRRHVARCRDLRGRRDRGGQYFDGLAGSRRRIRSSRGGGLRHLLYHDTYENSQRRFYVHRSGLRLHGPDRHDLPRPLRLVPGLAFGDRRRASLLEGGGIFGAGGNLQQRRVGLAVGEVGRPDVGDGSHRRPVSHHAAGIFFRLALLEERAQLPVPVGRRERHPRFFLGQLCQSPRLKTNGLAWDRVGERRMYLRITFCTIMQSGWVSSIISHSKSGPRFLKRPLVSMLQLYMC
mmetsp:Transcript_17362/g.39200  ORF Transcript_17362/g.39200 Transcript_17362/m.39200 type:complete len:409 (-) Transcript_17362:662-1888(-)